MYFTGRSLIFMQILATAYIRNEPWEMGVHKRNGVVYLDVHKLPERPRSELDRSRYQKSRTFMTSPSYFYPSFFK